MQLYRYSRLPDDLLSTTITSLHATVIEGSLFRRDHNCGLLVSIQYIATALCLKMVLIIVFWESDIA